MKKTTNILMRLLLIVGVILSAIGVAHVIQTEQLYQLIIYIPVNALCTYLLFFKADW